MSFKFSLIFIQFYCLFVVINCVEDVQFDNWDGGLDSSSLYTTRELPETQSNPPKPASVAKKYSLDRVIAAELELLVHKITRTFVEISQTKEGQNTLMHIHDAYWSIISDENVQATVAYVVSSGLYISNNSVACSTIENSIYMGLDLLQYDFTNLHFVYPFVDEIYANWDKIQKIFNLTENEIAFIKADEERPKILQRYIELMQMFNADDKSTTGASKTTVTVPANDIGDVK